MAERDAGHGSSPQITEFTEADSVALSKTPLLHELTEEDRAAMRPHTHVVLLRRGDHLYEEGAVDDKLYVIIEGKVKLTRTSPDGREVLVRVQGPGEMFGELAMFDPTYRTSTAAAVTDARLAVIAHADLRDVLIRRPTVAMLLLKELAQRLRVITETTTNLIFTDVPGRVAKALLELADRFGEQQEDGIHVTHDLTQEELAQLVGASRETVNKALADFASRGWIQLSAKSVLLIDQERLRRRARLRAQSARVPGGEREALRDRAKGEAGGESARASRRAPAPPGLSLRFNLALPGSARVKT